MDKILITNLHVHGILGVEARERHRPQEIIINVIAETDTRPGARSDELRDCVDYAELVKEIRLLVGQARRCTVEALAEDIAGICLRRPGVSRAKVRLEKPEAVIGAEAVGVEIERPWPDKA